MVLATTRDVVAADTRAPVLAAGEDDNVDLGVDLEFDAFPFMTQLQEWAGGIQAVCLIVLGILFVVAIVAWIAGKASASQQMQRVSVGALIVCAIGAALTGAAFGITGYFAGFDLGF
ncbi:hypothetical protein ATJ88_2499 [Isoptericola jiangsuensis]|jgi:hypothetical protein|uniref:Uncharacterized protein n=1 Tax=Isoptericola jiangsuensis TaxID=548579 RepID=A0A2A9F049_9MICO|nr:hypothetical protein [Isoptericola jiangsuensis]PFG43789.1 hypothetical protein ATJ88_2499 [Isoptericola jiangsuensis]